MKLTMLGTGNALVTECYNTCFVLTQQNGEQLLVDGGGGNALLRQLKRAGIDWKNLRQIFITHKHMDHILGIIWMVRMICQNMRSGSYDGEAWIYGHEQVIALVRELSQKLLQEKEAAFLDTRLHLQPVTDGETRQLLGCETTFFDIGSTKARQFGFCMQLTAAEKLTCCGDEPYRECERQYAQNSKWLLHEAFCLAAEAEIFHPYEKHHSTVKDACALAEELGVQNLLLYHTEDSHLARRKELYTREGSEYYHGNLLIPDDLETIEL